MLYPCLNHMDFWDGSVDVLNTLKGYSNYIGDLGYPQQATSYAIANIISQDQGPGYDTKSMMQQIYRIYIETQHVERIVDVISQAFFQQYGHRIIVLPSNHAAC